MDEFSREDKWTKWISDCKIMLILVNTFLLYVSSAINKLLNWIELMYVCMYVCMYVINYSMWRLYKINS